MMTLKTVYARRAVEIGGGLVRGDASSSAFRLILPPTRNEYADAQVDDYGELSRTNYAWDPGTTLTLRARFSHEVGELRGTAGFGFWNAPFGPGTGLLPALPQAVWFFYASAPTDLPLAREGEKGRGWFVSTIDAGSLRALAWAPFAPLVTVLNQVASVRRRLWPAVQRALGISYRSVSASLTEWHSYRLAWQPQGCFFSVDGEPVLQTPLRPRGPLGFVCWIDNQYLVARPTGRLRWGTLQSVRDQWLEVENLRIARAIPRSR